MLNQGGTADGSVLIAFAPMYGAKAFLFGQRAAASGVRKLSKSGEYLLLATGRLGQIFCGKSIPLRAHWMSILCAMRVETNMKLRKGK